MTSPATPPHERPHRQLERAVGQMRPRLPYIHHRILQRLALKSGGYVPGVCRMSVYDLWGELTLCDLRSFQAVLRDLARRGWLQMEPPDGGDPLDVTTFYLAVGRIRAAVP